MRSLLLVLAAGLLACCAAGCEKARPVGPVAGIFAVRGQASVSWGDKKKPTVRRARPGMLLMSNVAIESDEGAVLEAFDGSFVWLPPGRHSAARLKLPVGAPEGALQPIVVVGAEATRKDVPPGVVMIRYEPPPAKPVEVGEDAQFNADMAFFFTPHGDAPEELEEKQPPTASPWKMKDRYVHALHRPLKAGNGARTLSAASGAVVVEFADMATAFASTLKLPVDLGEVKRVVVVDGQASLTLPAGKKVELKAGDIAVVEPLP